MPEVLVLQACTTMSVAKDENKTKTHWLVLNCLEAANTGFSKENRHENKCRHLVSVMAKNAENNEVI